MRYAVINSMTGEWMMETDDLDEAKAMFADIHKSGDDVVVVKVLLDSDDLTESPEMMKVPNIFEDD